MIIQILIQICKILKLVKKFICLMDQPYIFTFAFKDILTAEDINQQIQRNIGIKYRESLAINFSRLVAYWIFIL